MPNVSSFPSTEHEKPIQQSLEQKIQKDTLIEYLNVFGYSKILSENEQNQFIQTALANNLDPFKREIHIAIYGEGSIRKVSIITGYQTYLKRAERTGNLDGWRAWLEGTGDQMKAVVEIHRKDWSHSFSHEVYYEEVVQKTKTGNPNQFWSKMPRFQLRKVAIAQAFRLAFPEDLSGLPYEPAELADNEQPSNDFNGTAMPVNSLENVKTSIQESVGNHIELSSKNITQNTSTSVHDSGSDDNFLSETIQQIENLFESHPEDFTTKHQEWILDKVHKAVNRKGVEKMLAYTEKVIRKVS